MSLHYLEKILFLKYCSIFIWTLPRLSKYSHCLRSILALEHTVYCICCTVHDMSVQQFGATTIIVMTLNHKECICIWCSECHSWKIWGAWKTAWLYALTLHNWSIDQQAITQICADVTTGKIVFKPALLTLSYTTYCVMFNIRAVSQRQKFLTKYMHNHNSTSGTVSGLARRELNDLVWLCLYPSGFHFLSVCCVFICCRWMTNKVQYTVPTCKAVGIKRLVCIYMHGLLCTWWWATRG